jgi:hypothetical protein
LCHSKDRDLLIIMKIFKVFSYDDLKFETLLGKSLPSSKRKIFDRWTKFVICSGNLL